MFDKIKNYLVYGRVALLVTLATYASASEQVPTFDLKNKSIDKLIMVVVHAKDDTTPRLTQIKDETGKVIRQGMHIPSQPIALLTDNSISYYDLRNLTGIDIFYSKIDYQTQKMRQWVKVVKFNNVDDATTFYLKYRYADTVIRGIVSDVDAQEGSKNKTTDGYRLANNIKNKNIESIFEQPAGSEKNYPIVNFNDGANNANKLTKVSGPTHKKRTLRIKNDIW